MKGTSNATTSETFYTVTNLLNSTMYAVQVLAKDAVNNQSALSTTVNATTTDGSTTTANELFFSEYVEGSSNNKALEIANVTNADINLSDYSIKRQTNGGQDGDDWGNTLTLSGTIIKDDVYVLINGNATNQTLLDEADFVQPNAEETNWGAPINFNGNDPVGLFKNDVLIDIIGTYNGGSSNFAKDITLRRKNDIAQPNTVFDEANEWDAYPQDTVDDIGQHNTTLHINDFIVNRFKTYPNPIDSLLTIKNIDHKLISKLFIYNLLGEEIITYKNPQKKIEVSFLSKGIYIIKLEVENEMYSLKIIKN